MNYGRGGFGNVTPMARNLILANVVIFVLMLVSPTLHQTIFRYGALFFPGSTYFVFTQFFTYMFLHGGFFHIIFNMLGLWMFGTAIEMVWGWKRFLNFYLACGLGGAVLHVLMMYILIPDTISMSRDLVPPMVGASGAIYGLLVAYAYLFPNNKMMMIFLPIPIKAKYFVPLMIGLDLFLGLSGRQTGIAHFGHVGGALVGLIFCFGGNLKRWMR